MTSLDPLVNCTEFRLEGQQVLSAGDEVGVWHPEQSRLEWFWPSLGIDSVLNNMAREEALLWDQWASGESHKMASRSPNDRERFSLAGWLERYPNIKDLFGRSTLSPNLRGLSVLDIGGSGKDLVYWLKEKPFRIDQIEVSPKSQLLCQKRVRDVFQGESEVPICYHTIPAEYLPFDDNVFDFVFSRATLHHCVRPSVFSEIVRVMKPGGTLIFVEPHLSKPVYWLMRARRTVLRKDRGTDDPLRAEEIKMLQRRLASSTSSSTAYYSHNILFQLRRRGSFEDLNQAHPLIATQISFLGKKASSDSAVS